MLDAFEQAVHDRLPTKGMGLVHHSDRGSQFLSVEYTERLAKAGIEPSVGSVGDSYENALAETIIGLSKAQVIHRRGPWRSFEAVEFASIEWVDWCNKPSQVRSDQWRSPAIPPRTHREHPARKSRSALLRRAGH